MAANSIAKLAVIITGDSSPLKSSLAQTAGALQAFTGTVSGASGAAGGFATVIGGLTMGPLVAVAAGVAAAAAAVIAFGRAGIAAAAQMEQLKISLEVMTGSAQTAKDLLADMQKLSVETPLEMSDIQQAGKTLMAMGEPTGAIIDDLKMLGDIAAGTGQPLNELAQVFGQVMQAGRLTGNELRQFNERGVPLLTVLSEQMGVSKQAIREMVEAGQIGAGDVVKAFQAMSGEGGRFANMMERQTDTLIGQWNKFKENMTIIAMQIMKPIADAIKEILKLINSALDGLVSLLGVQRSDGYKTSDSAAVKALREQEKAQKDAEAAAKKADDEQKKRMDDLKKRGESMAKAMRTPFELMRDGIQEAVDLLNAGVISTETYERAVKKIGDEYRKATEDAKKLNDVNKPVNAYDRFSAGAFSAIQAAGRENSAMVAEQRKSQSIEREIATNVSRVEQAVRNQPTTRISVARLN